MRISRIIAIFLTAVLLCACTPADSVQSDTDTAEADILTGIFTASVIPHPQEYEIHPQIPPVWDEETGTVTWVGVITARFPTPDGFENTSEYFLLTSDKNGTLLQTAPITVPLDGKQFIEGGCIRNGTLTAGILVQDGERHTRRILRFDPADGTSALSDPIDHLFTGSPYINKLLVSEDRICLHTDTELLLLDENSGLLARISFVFPPDALCLSPDGVFHVLLDNGRGQMLYPVDPERKSLGTGVSLSDSYVRNVLFSPDGTLYYTDASGLFAYAPDKSSEIMNFEHSGTELFHLTVHATLGSTCFFAVETGYTNPSPQFAVFTKAEDLHLSSVCTLSLAAASLNYELTDLVNEFNRSHPGIRVQITDYSAYNTADNPAGGKEKLLFDLSVGNVRPDIVYAHWDADVMRYLLRDGLYLDLYTFLDKDPDYAREDFLGAYLRTYTINGNLWGMTPYLHATTLVGTKNSLSGRTSWTAQEMLSFARSLPDAVSFTDHMSLHDLEYMILGDSGYGTFIENGTFASAAYENWLTLIEHLPAYRPDEPTSADEIEAMRYGEFLARKNGQTVVTPYNLSSAEAWHGIRALFDTDETVLIGYPTQSGGYASVSAGPSFLITSFTEMPDMAWELVKTCCLPPKGTNRTFTAGLPLLKSDLIAETGKLTGKTVISYYTGGCTTREHNPYDPFTEENLKKPGVFALFTEEDASALLNYLDNHAGIPLADRLPEEIDAVFREEISSFRNGIYTAEECVQRTQSRIALWLAEQK